MEKEIVIDGKKIKFDILNVIDKNNTNGNIHFFMNVGINKRIY